jgi:hypothetical protein
MRVLRRNVLPQPSTHGAGFASPYAGGMPEEVGVMIYRAWTINMLESSQMPQ